MPTRVRILISSQERGVYINSRAKRIINSLWDSLSQYKAINLNLPEGFNSFPTWKQLQYKANRIGGWKVIIVREPKGVLSKKSLFWTMAVKYGVALPKRQKKVKKKPVVRQNWFDSDEARQRFQINPIPLREQVVIVQQVNQLPGQLRAGERFVEFVAAQEAALENELEVELNAVDQQRWDEAEELD